MLEVFADFLNLGETDELYLAAFYVLSQNLVHGDALTMLMSDGRPITFAEWGYLGKEQVSAARFSFRDSRSNVFFQSGRHTLRPSR